MKKGIEKIETAMEKRDMENEYIKAVIKAMKPGLQFQSYIATPQDLTLPWPRQILR